MFGKCFPLEWMLDNLTQSDSYGKTVFNKVLVMNYVVMWLRGRRVIGISGSPIRSKPWWKWHLTSAVNLGEVRRVHLAKSTLLTPRWCPWDLFRSFKVCSDATAPIQSLVTLQPCLLSLRWKTCLRQYCSLWSVLGQNTLLKWSWWHMTWEPTLWLSLWVIVLMVLMYLRAFCVSGKGHARVRASFPPSTGNQLFAAGSTAKRFFN